MLRLRNIFQEGPNLPCLEKIQFCLNWVLTTRSPHWVSLNTMGFILDTQKLTRAKNVFASQRTRNWKPFWVLVTRYSSNKHCKLQRSANIWVQQFGSLEAGNCIEKLKIGLAYVFTPEKCFETTLLDLTGWSVCLWLPSEFLFISLEMELKMQTKAQQ